MAGLTPTEVTTMIATLAELRRSRGLTFILVEHVRDALMQLSDRILALEQGTRSLLARQPKSPKTRMSLRSISDEPTRPAAGNQRPLSGYGQVTILHGVDIDIAPGSITA